MNREKPFFAIDIVFNSILMGQLLLGFIFYYLIDSKTIEPFLTEFQFLPLVVLIVNTIFILTVKYIFTKRVKIDKKLSIEEKLSRYKSLSIIIIVLLDIANIFNLLIYLFSGSSIYLIVAVLVLILYFIYRPNADRFAQDSLTGQERNTFLAKQ